MLLIKTGIEALAKAEVSNISIALPFTFRCLM
jgi:hypothetical protein